MEDNTYGTDRHWQEGNGAAKSLNSSHLTLQMKTIALVGLVGLAFLFLPLLLDLKVPCSLLLPSFS